MGKVNTGQGHLFHLCSCQLAACCHTEMRTALRRQGADGISHIGDRKRWIPSGGGALWCSVFSVLASRPRGWISILSRIWQRVQPYHLGVGSWWRVSVLTNGLPPYATFCRPWQKTVSWIAPRHYDTESTMPLLQVYRATVPVFPSSRSALVSGRRGRSSFQFPQTRDTSSRIGVEMLEEGYSHSLSLALVLNLGTYPVGTISPAQRINWQSRRHFSWHHIKCCHRHQMNQISCLGWGPSREVVRFCSVQHWLRFV